MKTVAVQLLTKELFAPFGEVIETAGARNYPINGGTTTRFHDLACLDPGPKGRIIANIFRGQPFAAPVELKIMERHPLGSQAFIPLGARPYLVVVAQAGEHLRSESVMVFLAAGWQGVNYHSGVWHHPLLALGQTSDFLVLDRDGPDGNCEERPLPRPLVVEKMTLQSALDRLGSPLMQACA